jgi:hypothetical protein
MTSRESSGKGFRSGESSAKRPWAAERENDGLVGGSRTSAVSTTARSAVLSAAADVAALERENESARMREEWRMQYQQQPPFEPATRHGL